MGRLERITKATEYGLFPLFVPLELKPVRRTHIPRLATFPVGFSPTLPMGDDGKATLQRLSQLGWWCSTRACVLRSIPLFTGNKKCKTLIF